MRFFRFYGALCLYALLLLTGCKDKGRHAPVIDAARPYLPVIKIKLNAAQRAAGEKAGWETVSGLFVIIDNKVAQYPVGCRYNYQNDTLYYRPLQPLSASLQFEIQIFNNGDTSKQRFSTPAIPDNMVASVNAVYPQGDVIPANILMFHVVFSTPITEDVLAYKHVKLLDENGVEKQRVWREKSNWASAGRHLVLMLHPGRVKRGISYFEGEEPLFIPGKKYTLVVTTELKDANSRRLKKEYRKTFNVAAVDREIPLFLKDRFTAPKAGSLEPVSLVFSERMDYGTMNIGVTIKDENNSKIEGTLSTTDEKNWQFIPANPWQNEDYTVELNDYITDLASNHLTRHFEETELDSIRNRNSVSFVFKPR